MMTSEEEEDDDGGEEEIVLIQRHPTTTFHFFLVTSSQVRLYDERCMDRPLLAWKHHVDGGPRTFNVIPLTFTANPYTSALFYY